MTPSSRTSESRQYAIKELPASSPVGFSPRGGALKLWRSKAPEVMLSGPAETGKTFASLQKLNALMWRYPGSQAVIIRKTLASLYPSVFQTYRNIVGPEPPVTYFGGKKPEWIDYPNGSRIYIAGMDNPQKALSSERDFIYANQAEELTLDDWETLSTRCTGRAANAPYSQMLGDCNPSVPAHWIRHRPRIECLESRHEDNPTLFDDAGQITPRGIKTLQVLDALTGVRKDRLRHGKWVQAEGVVYQDWDRAVHLIDRFEIPADWRRIRSIDFGFTNPFCCLWIAIDNDGRMYIYREIYWTRRTVRLHAEQINELSRGESYSFTVADHDAEDRATLLEAGIATVPARKDRSRCRESVMERLKDPGDGRRRLYYLRDSLVERDPELREARKSCSFLDEIDVFVWKKSKDGRPVKEEPEDRDDHAMDAIGYASLAVDGRVPLIESDESKKAREKAEEEEAERRHFDWLNNEGWWNQ